MISIIIVDDQVLLRESIKYIIEQDKDIKVVGVANDGFEALKECEKHVPRVVLMDIMMPNCNGIEGTRLIKEKYNSIKILILTTFKDDENIKYALKNGADGYILKDINPDDLILAIKSIDKGFSVMHESAQKSFVNQINKNSNSKKVSNNIFKEKKVTEREISIIKLIVDGKSNKEIANELFLSEGTVKNLISAVLDKLELKDRTQLAVMAVKNDLV